MREEWEELERRHSAPRDGLGKLVALGAAAMLAFLGWTQFAGGLASVTAREEPPIEAFVMPSKLIEPRQEPDNAPAKHQSRPVPRAGRESYVAVYECVVNGQRVVSDVPCAADAQARTLVIDQPDPYEVARRQQEQWQARQSAGGYPAERSPATRSMPQAAPSNEAQCAAVARAIDNLNARMRQRYTSAEGEWLREQWRDLKRRRYDLKCGR